MRVVAYVRVSTDEQADKGNSLSEQRERLEAYCVAMGWGKPKFILDDGYSAKDLKRPGIKRLINHIEKREFDIILTSKLDRLCRNLLDLLQLVDFFSEHKCSYVSASESFDTSTAVGRMTLQLLGTFAEFERERIRERVKDNMVSLAKNTDKALTQACYGFDIVNGQYVINEKEAANVRYMFELAQEGQGHRTIAKLLNQRGVTTKRGKPWDQINVKRLMNTETLMGTMVYNKRKTEKGKTVIRDKSEWIVKEDNHPAIIPKDIFMKTQEIFASRSRSHKYADSESYLLTGLVKCEYCAGGMKGSTSRHKTKYNEYTYHRYICSAYVSGYGCRHHAVHRDDLEHFVINRIKEFAKSGGKVAVKQAEPFTIQEQIKEIQVALNRLDRSMQKQIEAYENDLISGRDLKLARMRIDSERTELQGRLQRVQNSPKNSDNLKRKAEDLLEDITGADRVRAKNAIRQIIDSVKVKGSEVSLVYRA